MELLSLVVGALWLGLLTWKLLVYRKAIRLLAHDNRMLMESLTAPDLKGVGAGLTLPPVSALKEALLKTGVYPMGDEQDAAMEKSLRKLRRDQTVLSP